VGYEEELKPEVKALREKLRDCKLLAKQKVCKFITYWTNEQGHYSS